VVGAYHACPVTKITHPSYLRTNTGSFDKVHRDLPRLILGEQLGRYRRPGFSS
jgi:hypothetical protein